MCARINGDFMKKILGFIVSLCIATSVYANDAMSNFRLYALQSKEVRTFVKSIHIQSPH